MHTFLQISHIQLPKGSRQVTHNIEIVVRENMGISQPLETRQTTGYLLEMRKRLVFADSIWEHGWDWCFSDFFLRSQIIVYNFPSNKYLFKIKIKYCADPTQKFTH